MLGATGAYAPVALAQTVRPATPLRTRARHQPPGDIPAQGDGVAAVSL